MAWIDEFLDKDRSLPAVTAITVGIAAGVVLIVALVLFSFFVSVISGILFLSAGYVGLAGRELFRTDGGSPRRRRTGMWLLAAAAVMAGTAAVYLIS